MTAALVPVAEQEFSIDRLVQQKAVIQRAFGAVMKEGEHYGIIPGCQKPSLWQPGADTLCFMFRLRADYEVLTSIQTDGCISFTMRCRLYHIETGKEWGSGVGACNTREKRYSTQTSERICPKCQKKPGTIIKGKEEYGGGWVCWSKQGGCGAKFADDAPEMKTVDVQVAAAGVWDLQNTILKMASKRAKVAAVLTATAASDIFTQDIEDLIDYMPPAPKEKTGDELLASAAARHAAETGTPTTIVQGQREERRPPQSAPAPAPADRCTCVHAPEQHQHSTGCEVMGCHCHWRMPAAPKKPAPAPPAPPPAKHTSVRTGVTPPPLQVPHGKPDIYPLAAPAQVKKLNIAVAESLGIRDRDEKLKWYAGMLGFKVPSSNQIPANRISGLIAAAERGEVPKDWARLASTDMELIELPEVPA